jgi:hypothetical protein
LHILLERGLTATADLWPPVRVAFGWVHRVAHLLDLEDASRGAVQGYVAGLLGAMARHRQRAGPLADAVDHFVKVTRSYWPGLFWCYDRDDLPRTNNALEQQFGSHRYHERRATGRKRASPGLVLRGSVRLVAAVATRQRAYTAKDLAGTDRAAWQQCRRHLEERRQRRVQRWRFRRDPKAYLHRLEELLHQSGMPS